jgi:hypothetical protein
MSTFTQRELTRHIWGGGIVALTALIVTAVSQGMLVLEIGAPEFIRTGRLYAVVVGALAALWTGLAFLQPAKG